MFCKKIVGIHDHVGYPGIHVVYLPKIKYICIRRLKCSRVHMTRNVGAGHQSDDQQWAITLFSEKNRDTQVSGYTSI